MAKKRRHHEDHINHEAWAIPYGDLLTLLLAFFVVMYSISSINQGKYKVLSEALSQAFGGPPKSIKPIQVGDFIQKGSNADQLINLLRLKDLDQVLGATVHHQSKTPSEDQVNLNRDPQPDKVINKSPEELRQYVLNRVSDQIQSALNDLIKEGQVRVSRTSNRIEVEIGTDILFGSGSSDISGAARPILAKVAGALSTFELPLRIEGYTDNRPIHTPQFPSNWELSAARAATVVHLFMDQGVDPARMSVAGYGEYRPLQDNGSAESRNRNRRVLVVILTQADDVPPAVTETKESDTSVEHQQATPSQPQEADPMDGGQPNDAGQLNVPRRQTDPLLNPSRAPIGGTFGTS